MQYVAAVSGKGWEVDRVKEQLLQSNPVLEGVCLFLYFFVLNFNISKVALRDRESAKRVVESKECLKALLPPALLPCIS